MGQRLGRGLGCRALPKARAFSDWLVLPCWLDILNISQVQRIEMNSEKEILVGSQTFKRIQNPVYNKRTVLGNHREIPFLTYQNRRDRGVCLSLLLVRVCSLRVEAWACVLLSIPRLRCGPWPEHAMLNKRPLLLFLQVWQWWTGHSGEARRAVLCTVRACSWSSVNVWAEGDVCRWKR